MRLGLGLGLRGVDDLNAFARLKSLLADGNTVAAYRAGVGLTGASAAFAWASYAGSFTYTNLALNSEDLRSSAGWSNDNCTVTAAGITPPPGVGAMWKIANDGVLTAHTVRRSPTLANSTIYTFSAHVMANELSWVVLRTTNKAGSAGFTWFNLATGAFGTVDALHLSYGKEALQGGGYRIWVSFNSSSGASSPDIGVELASANNVRSFAGTVGHSIYAGAPQCVADFIPQRYVATTGSTATGTASGATFGQATAANQPTINADGSLTCVATASGTGQLMQTPPFTLSQPTTLYLTMRPTEYNKAWSQVYLSGVGADVSFYNNTPASLGLYAGSTATQFAGPTVNTKNVFAIGFNGASTFWSVNGGSKNVAAAGANNMGGLTIGARYLADLSRANATYWDIIARNGFDTAAKEAQIINELRRLNNV